MIGCVDGNNTVAMVALSLSQDEEYHDIPWELDIPDNKAAVIRLLGVDPALQKQGLGKQVVKECIRMAGYMGKKAIRLDCLATNLPAQRLYESMGFVCRGKKNMQAPNVGEAEFLFYEYQM